MLFWSTVTCMLLVVTMNSATAASSNIAELIIPGMYTNINFVQSSSLATNVLAASLTAEAVWFATLTPLASTIIGQPKTNKQAFAAFQSSFVTTTISNKQGLPSNFKYFGTGDDKLNLKYFLLSNPFFASALIPITGSTGLITGYEVKSANDVTNRLFYRACNTLPAERVLINAQFDASMNVKSMTAYQFGVEIPNACVSIKQQALCASRLAFLFTFYSELVHSLLHIFEYQMITGLYVASSKSVPISAWSTPYFPAISLKYNQVGGLLLTPETGAMVGGAYLGNFTEVMALLSDVAVQWGNSKTAIGFLETFYNGTETLFAKQSSKVLVEFFKQVSLIPSFVGELMTAFSTVDPTGYANVNSALQSYFASLPGTQNTISNLSEWLQVMTVVGIFHGSTISFSRLMMTANIQAQFNYTNKFYTELEFNNMFEISETITGFLNSYQTYTNSTYSSTQIKQMTPAVTNVLSKFLSKSNALKNQYYKSLKPSTSSIYANYGYILNDFAATNMMDGRQFTLTTYV